jgi:hypothetical protein|tara:strand:- start:363 stop:527 length:165 start_codon:yes stop_codon:yes gene_type:complete
MIFVCASASGLGLRLRLVPLLPSASPRCRRRRVAAVADVSALTIPAGHGALVIG